MNVFWWNFGAQCVSNLWNSDEIPNFTLNSSRRAQEKRQEGKKSPANAFSSHVRFYIDMGYLIDVRCYIFFICYYYFYYFYLKTTTTTTIINLLRELKPIYTSLSLYIYIYTHTSRVRRSACKIEVLFSPRKSFYLNCITPQTRCTPQHSNLLITSPSTFRTLRRPAPHPHLPSWRSSQYSSLVFTLRFSDTTLKFRDTSCPRSGPDFTCFDILKLRARLTRWNILTNDTTLDFPATFQYPSDSWGYTCFDTLKFRDHLSNRWHYPFALRSVSPHLEILVPHALPCSSFMITFTISTTTPAL